MQEVSLLVKTDGSLSLEENMRQNLLACYTELVDILKQMAVTHVSRHQLCEVFIYLFRIPV